jgi:PIN domain nuclease of toxin-antitoxin system
VTAPLLDTHAWIWWVNGDERLDRRLAGRLDAMGDSDRPALSAISLWEAAMLATIGRVEYRSGFDAWLARAAHPATVRLLPLTIEVASEVRLLPDSFRRDPADRIIVATSRVHQLPVLTADRAILDSDLIREWRG